VPAALVNTTARAALAASAGEAAAAGLVSGKVAALTEGVLRTMFLAKVKSAAVWFLAICVLGGASVVTHRALADKPAAPEVVKQEKPKPAADDKPGDKGNKNDGQKGNKDDGQKGNKPEAAATLHGTIESVEADKITITIPGEKGKKESENKTFPLAKDVKVLISEGVNKGDPPMEGKLADLRVGAPAEVRLSEDKKTVVEVRPQGQTIYGAMKSAKDDSITIASKVKGGGEDKAYTLSKDVKVLLNDGLIKGTPDKEGKVGDLKEGTTVSLHLSARDGKVLAIRVQGESTTGSVTSVNAEKGTLTVETKGKDGAVEQTYTVAKDARIEGQGGGNKGEKVPPPQLKLSDLTAGTPVHLRLSVFDPKSVVYIQVLPKNDKPVK
jgi:hypothetical protein